MITYLDCVFTSQNSFGNKATVETQLGSNAITLRSYNLVVARVEDGAVKLFNTSSWTSTTLRHVKEFLLQNDFDAKNKAQILRSYPIAS